MINWLQIHADRRKRLLELMPDLYDYSRVLYIGADPQRTELIPQFLEKGYEIDVLEAWPLNVAMLEALNASKRWFKHVYCGIAQEAGRLIKDRYDVVVWWHGREHIERSQVKDTMNGLVGLATKLVVAACPFGVHEQGPTPAPFPMTVPIFNDYNIHRSYLYPEDFEASWNRDVAGERDAMGANLLVWRRV